jgi:glutathione peroxidase
VTPACYKLLATRYHKKSKMTFRRKLLKIFYPALMWFSRLKGKKKKITGSTVPPASFYDLKTTLNNGKELDFSTLKGKKVLLVNTASDCGYTHQYKDLQTLYENFKDQLVIIGFPANDFKEQEKGSDEEIASFCEINYGVTFPLAKKSTVIKSENQHPVFQWASEATKNGWNSKEPSWNFSKYLVNESGVLTNYFAPSVDPLSAEVKSALGL